MTSSNACRASSLDGLDLLCEELLMDERLVSLDSSSNESSSGIVVFDNDEADARVDERLSCLGILESPVDGDETRIGSGEM